MARLRTKGNQTMPKYFRVTYNIVTPESAEQGDFAECGFVLPGGWHTSADTDDETCMTLREAMNLCSPQSNSGAGCWMEEDSRTDYHTSAEERRSIHPPRDITAASYARVTKLLGL
jgi:hypothetical protein